MAKKTRKIVLGVVLAVVAMALLVVGLFVANDAPIPTGAKGPAAQALAQKMLSAIQKDAWDKTLAVRFRLAEGRPLHLWDRARNLAAVHYDTEDPKVLVLLDASNKHAVAFAGETLFEGEDLVEWTDKAYADFVNDSFWMNAPSKAYDEGTTRALVKKFDDKPLPSGAGLLVSYASGGVTPGDAYLWELDERGQPIAWRMWVRILPVGGVRVTWEDWITLSTGAKVAKTHQGPLGLKMNLDPLEGAASLAELVPGDDPFLRLLNAPKLPEQKENAASQPAPVAPSEDAEKAESPSAATDAGASAP